MLVKGILFACVVGQFFSTSLSQAGRIQTLASVAQNLTIEDAIQIAFDRNLAWKQKKLAFESAKIAYDNAWDTMYMPTVSMTFTSDSQFSALRIPGTPAATSTGPGLAKGYPTASAGVSLGSYTLFNFFQDKLQFDNNKMQWERAKQQFEEGKRAIRNQVVNSYFRARTDQAKLEAAQRSLDMSQAILELVKSRKKLGQATEDEVSSSNVDFLTAKTATDQAAQTSFESMANFNIFLDTDTQQKFILTSNIKYVSMKLTVDEAYKVFNQTGPTVLDANLALKGAEINFELAEKKRLPLPVVSFSGIGLSYTRGYAGGTNTMANSPSSGTPAGQFNVSAAVNFSMPLWGPGGFLGSRTIDSARISRDNAEISYTTTMNGVIFEIKRRIESIRREEGQLKSTKEIFDSSLKLLESVFAKVSGAKVNRLEVRDAINQERFSEAGYLDAVLQHFADKLALGEYLGIDVLPGEEGYK